MACLLNRKACADYLGVSLRTVRYWDAGRHRVPWAVVRLLRLLRCGDLGGVDDAWEGFRLFHGVLYTPDGRGFSVDALRSWWLMVEQARFWRQDYDRKAQARRDAHATVGSPLRLDSPTPADGGALDLVPVAGDEVRPVARQAARDPVPLTTTPPTAPEHLTAAAPPCPSPDGVDGPTQGERRAAELPRRASAAPAVGQSGAWVASRYARRRRAARSTNGVNLVSWCYHQGADIGVTLEGCIMGEMALDCGFPAVLDACRGVPPANRGLTNLNSFSLVSDCHHNSDFSPVGPANSQLGPSANRGQKSIGGAS